MTRRRATHFSWSRRVVINRVSTRVSDARCGRQIRACERKRADFRPLVAVGLAGCSNLGYPALHGAVNPGFEERDFGLAVEWPERGIQKLGAETGRADRSDRGTFVFVPNDGQTIVRHRP